MFLFHSSLHKIEGGFLEPRPSGVISGESAVFAANKRFVSLMFLAKWTDLDLSFGSTGGIWFSVEQYPRRLRKNIQGQNRIRLLRQKNRLRGRLKAWPPGDRTHQKSAGQNRENRIRARCLGRAPADTDCFCHLRGVYETHPRPYQKKGAPRPCAGQVANAKRAEKNSGWPRVSARGKETEAGFFSASRQEPQSLQTLHQKLKTCSVNRTAL